MNTENPVTTPDARTSDQIESEIRDTRHRMDATLDELGNRLSPRSLLNSALDWWESPDTGNQGTAAAKQAAISLARQARQHPVPALLIGSGIAWLISESRDGGSHSHPHSHPHSGHPSNGHDSQSTLKGARDAAMDAFSKTEEKLHHAASAVSSQAHHAMDHTKSAARRITHELKDGYEIGTRRFGRACDEYPLAVGLAMAAMGALVGLALPRSRQEDRLMGESSDRMMGEAKDLAHGLAESGMAVGTRVVEAVKEEASQQGLTGENLGAKISELVEMGTQVAHKAKDEAVHAAEEEGLAPPLEKPPQIPPGSGV